MLGNSLVAAQVAASQEGLSVMELVIPGKQNEKIRIGLLTDQNRKVESLKRYNVSENQINDVTDKVKVWVLRFSRKWLTLRSSGL
jgi:hypothetical protein